MKFACCHTNRNWNISLCVEIFPSVEQQTYGEIILHCQCQPASTYHQFSVRCATSWPMVVFSYAPNPPPKDFSYASFRACCHAQPSKRNPKSLSQNKNARIQRQALAVKFPQILNLSPNPSPPPSSRLALCSIFPETPRHRAPSPPHALPHSPPIPHPGASPIVA
jgi:hypothetical protein